MTNETKRWIAVANFEAKMGDDLPSSLERLTKMTAAMREEADRLDEIAKSDDMKSYYDHAMISNEDNAIAVYIEIQVNGEGSQSLFAPVEPPQ